MSIALVSSGTSVDLPLRVARHIALTADVVAIELVAEDGQSAPSWSPGSHVEIDVPGVGSRQYSLCGDPDASGYTIAVKRETDSRGGSEYLHTAIVEGTTVRVTAVRNHFELEAAAAYRFVAGGIGITPVLAMVRHAQASGVPWTLLYLGRDRDSMPFLDVIESWGGSNVTVHESSVAGTLDIASVLGPDDDAMVYCCGPEPLMAAVEDAGHELGRAVRTERFAPKDEALKDGDHGFTLVLTESDLELWVPSDRTALEVMSDAGVDILSSCQEGTCGTCEVLILDGVADHRDSILDDDERAANEYMYVCVSRCVGPRLEIEY